MTAVAKPCPWMRRALDRMLGSELRGPLKWYAEWHVRRCPQCGATYRALLAARDALRRLGGSAGDFGLGEDRWRQIEEACRPNED